MHEKITTVDRQHREMWSPSFDCRENWHVSSTRRQAAPHVWQLKFWNKKFGKK